MAKPLNDILKGVRASKVVPGSTGKDPGVDYAPKAKGEQDFVAKHKTEKHADRVGNGDDVYQGKTEYVLNKATEKRHGYTLDDAEKVYESSGEYFRGSFKRDETKPLKHTHEFDYQMKGGKVTFRSKHNDEASAKKQRDSFLSKPERYHSIGKITKVNEDFHDSSEEQDLIALEEATAKQINDRLDSLTAAKKAEKAGDKKAQYGHMADYHLKYATHSKKSSDIAQHKSQAEKYRAASKMFEESKCNMTEEGKYCPVHENATCPTQKTLKEKPVKESLAFPLIGSHDDESAEMAKTQLRALANKALALAMHLSDDQVVEPWVQAKIAVAKDNVTAVHDYMLYGDHDEPEKEQTAPYDGGIDMSGAPRNTYPSFSADVNTGRNV